MMESPERGSDRQLIDFISNITDGARLRIEENLPHGFVRLKVAEAERRQAQHDIRTVEDIITELVRNSRDAGAGVVLVGFQKEQGRYRRITVLDDGRGIPEEMHRLVFEPRVTSKREEFEEDRYGVHGRGMALFSISSRCQSVRIASSRPGVGTAMTLTADTERVTERTDQATMPRLERADDGERVGPGPHNVARILLEMSVDHPEMRFYIGSFAEVIATARGMDARDGHARRVWSEAAVSRDARALAEACAAIGLPISERNAYRVIGGEIPELPTVYEMASASVGDAGPVPRNGGAVEPRQRAASQARNPLGRLGRDDLREIAEGAGDVVEKVVGRYYLRTAGEPRVRKGRGKLTISFYVAGEEGEER